MPPELFAALSACQMLIAVSSGPSGMDVMRLAMEHDRTTAYSCVRELRTWESEEIYRVVRDQSASGAHKTLVLSPLSKQGHTIIDNGRQYYSYDPDKKTLTVQDSGLGRLTSTDTKRRLRLMQRNYDVKKEDDARVAGRSCHRVSLKPHEKSMAFGRSFYVDKEKNVVLRVDLQHPDGEWKVMSKTVKVTYPRTLPDEMFDPKFVETPRRVHIRAPRRTDSLRTIREDLGFQPVHPVRMPGGLMFVGVDAVTGDDVKMAILHYTDGATNVAVYQAPGRKPPWKDRSTERVEELWVRVHGDLPEAGKRALLTSIRSSGYGRDGGLRARAAQQFGTSETLIIHLRDHGLTYGDIAACMTLKKMRGAPVSEVRKLIMEGYGLGELAQRYSIPELSLTNAVNSFWKQTY